MKTRIQITLGILGLVALTAFPAIMATQAQAGGGWVNGHYRGPPDGQCWNNKRGC